MPTRWERLRLIVAPSAALVLLVAIWELAARFSDTPDFLLPAPSELLEFITANLGLLVSHARATITASVLGFLIAVGFSLVLSVLMVWSRTFEATVYPLVVITQVIPKVAVAPLLIVYLGFGLAPKIFLAFLVAFFPLVINTTLGLRAVSSELLQLLHSLKAGRVQILMRIRFPTALPYIVEGAKIAIAFAIIGAIVGEFLAGNRGLGYLVNASTVSLNTQQGFSALIVLTIVGVLLFEIVQVVGKWMLPWYRDGERAGG
jgi:NitT/TauT family transport system permease protein